MILIANSCMAVEEKESRGRPLRKVFRTTPLSSKENALCDIERTLQKGHLCSFANKGRDPDPQDLPLVARPSYSNSILPWLVKNSSSKVIRLLLASP